MQNAVTEELLAKVKKLLGIADDDKTKDYVLTYIIETLLQKVCDDCNLIEVPVAFYGIVCKLTVNEYRLEKYGQGELDSEIKSMSAGDVSWGYRTTSETIVGAMKVLGVTEEYNRKVRQYRKVRW